jgi:hypothetical protein
MDLIPPTNTPKPSRRRLLQAVIVGTCGAIYGAAAGFFSDDPFLFILCPIGGAFAGFLFLGISQPQCHLGARRIENVRF